ncbi:MAG: methylated-DNA--[protein]-cysteine S-methyltransferase [Gammaproteobacteria bacterium]|nr:methylated-DNA--[protein]-cysteine S-methyltransferase [Gammaproteobacteria bacterium]
MQWSEQAISSINFTTKQNPLAGDTLPKKWLETFNLYWDRPLDRTTQSALAALPLDLAGTNYQRRVWSALQQIPLGETASYGAISDQLTSAPQAVAAACRANPVVLAVPCHRVISKSGIGGFMGATEGDPVDIKRWLINHETHVPHEQQ